MKDFESSLNIQGSIRIVTEGGRLYCRGVGWELNLGVLQDERTWDFAYEYGTLFLLDGEIVTGRWKMDPLVPKAYPQWPVPPPPQMLQSLARIKSQPGLFPLRIAIWP